MPFMMSTCEQYVWGLSIGQETKVIYLSCQTPWLEVTSSSSFNLQPVWHHLRKGFEMIGSWLINFFWCDGVYIKHHSHQCRMMTCYHFAFVIIQLVVSFFCLEFLPRKIGEGVPVWLSNVVQLGRWTTTFFLQNHGMFSKLLFSEVRPCYNQPTLNPNKTRFAIWLQSRLLLWGGEVFKSGWIVVNVRFLGEDCLEDP